MSPELEFPTKAAADRVRDQHSDHLCTDDDRRLKTVTFTSDTPESVIDQAEAVATSEQAAADRPSIEAVELTEAEKRDFDFSRDGVNVPKARYLKGLGAEYGVDAFQHVDPGEVDNVTDARPILERAAKSGGIDRGGGANYDDEATERQQRERREQAEKHAKEGCDHARDSCEHGEPEACEFLTEACGYDDQQVEQLLSGGSTTDETSTEQGLSGEQKGALQRSWGGYKAAISEIDRLLTHLEERKAAAQQAFAAINQIREQAGQEPITPELLHEQLETTQDLAVQNHAEHR